MPLVVGPNRTAAHIKYRQIRSGGAITKIASAIALLILFLSNFKNDTIIQPTGIIGVTVTRNDHLYAMDTLNTLRELGWPSLLSMLTMVILVKLICSKELLQMDL